MTDCKVPEMDGSHQFDNPDYHHDLIQKGPVTIHSQYRSIIQMMDQEFVIRF